MHFFLNKVGYERGRGFVEVSLYNRYPYQLDVLNAFLSARPSPWRMLARRTKWLPNMASTQRLVMEAKPITQ